MSLPDLGPVGLHGSTWRAATDAMRRSTELQAAAGRLCLESRAERLASRPHLRYARIEGHVDSSAVSAVVRTDGSISADKKLIQRAELVTALGDTFDNGRVAAGLYVGPLAAALTLLRACDRVSILEMPIAVSGTAGGSVSA